MSEFSDATDQQVYPWAVLGFREWEIRDGELGARWRDGEVNPWKSRLASASCDRLIGHLHKAPEPECGCGLNAYHSLTDLCATWHLRGAEREWLAQGHLVCGAVAGAGRVQIHHEGWRAERAQILFLINTQTSHLARDRELAARYGVDLVHHTEALARAMRLCAPAPAQLIPDPPPENEYERARAEFLRVWGNR